MSMDGVNHMGDDPFAGRRSVWQKEMDKVLTENTKLKIDLAGAQATIAQLKEQLARFQQEAAA